MLGFVIMFYLCHDVINCPIAVGIILLVIFAFLEVWEFLAYLKRKKTLK